MLGNIDANQDGDGPVQIKQNDTLTDNLTINNTQFHVTSVPKQSENSNLIRVNPHGELFYNLNK